MSFSSSTYLSLLEKMVRKVGLFVENARGTFGGERKAPLTPSFCPLPILLQQTISILRLSIILSYAHSSVFLSKVNKVCIIIATIPCKKIFGTANSKGIVWFTIPYIYRKQAKTFIPTTIWPIMFFTLWFQIRFSNSIINTNASISITKFIQLVYI